MEKTVLVPEEFFVDCEQQAAAGLSGFRALRAARTGKMDTFAADIRSLTYNKIC